MKLCPQCEFIYEDDQSICDMDGKDLVYDPGPLVFEGTVRFTSPEIIDPALLPASLTASVPASQQTGWQSRHSAIAALAAIILVALIFVVYYAETHQPRSANAEQTSEQTSIQSVQPTQPVTTHPESAPEPDPVSVPPDIFAPSPGQSPVESPNVTPAAPSSVSISSAALGRGRMTSNPVIAGGSGASSHPRVIVWLKNGTSIKADEAWEKREGIWYRQAGMVTFLKRSRVIGIQRLDAPNPSPKSPTFNAEDSNVKSRTAIAQNRSRNLRPDPVKKESKVTSLLKKTGRILKKPFKF